MTNWPAAYRSSRAAEQAGRGFRKPARPPLRLVGPWDRPRAPHSMPRAGFWDQQTKLPKAANDNVRLAYWALRGVTFAARLHPIIRFLEAIYWFKWLYDRYAFGIAINGNWQFDFACNNGFFAAGGGGSCLVGQGAPGPIPTCLFNGAQMGMWKYTHTAPGGGPRYNYNGRYLWQGGNACPAPAHVVPHPFIPNPRQLPRVPQVAPEEIIPMIPLPWKLVPRQRPNRHAPGPIRRETGPQPNENIPARQPWRNPSRDPFEYPPPAETPDIVIDPRPVRPLPWWWPNGSPSPSPTPSPRPGTSGQPRPSDPPTVPGQTPGVGVGPQPTPGTPPAIAAKPGHKFAPPKPREKEKKGKIPPGLFQLYQRVGRNFGRFTEATDALNCVYDALPQTVRKRARAQRYGKNPSLSGKLQLIYQHHLQLDIKTIVNCLAVENLKDMAIGKVNRAHAELRKKHGIRGGYMSRLAKVPTVNIGGG